uniref:Homeobox domain-containing protein n=1 Tax=Parastrongyloides trichosuri TaxID=131310 RepID=A0A0N4Z0R1_PARTI
METVTVHVIVETKNVISFYNPTPVEKEILSTDVNLNSSIPLSRICDEILKIVGLSHKTKESEARLQFDKCKPVTFESLFPNRQITIGSVIEQFKNNFSIKIWTSLVNEDTNKKEMTITVKLKFLKIILETYSGILNSIFDPTIQNFANQIKILDTQDVSIEELQNLNKTLDEFEITKEESKQLYTPFDSIAAILNFTNSIQNSPRPSPIEGNNDEINSHDHTNESSPNIIPTLPSLSSVGITNSFASYNSSISNVPFQIKSEFIDKNSSILKLKQSKMLSSFNNFNGRTRLMFDTEKEIPHLENWYLENAHPGNELIHKYTDYLNDLSDRKINNKIAPHNVKIWFKNRRAKGKKMKSSS